MANNQTVEETREQLRGLTDAHIIAALEGMGFVVQRRLTAPSVPSDVLVTGSAKFVTMTGYPIVGARVTVEVIPSAYTITASSGEVIRPALSSLPAIYESDAEGVVEIPLVRGVEIRFYTSLSSAARRIRVPDVDFDLLSAGDEVDMFNPAPSRPHLLRGDM
ncbi:MAG: hypothetical protein ACO32I_01285 [Candidatus Limnocylindrus sp.]